MDNMIPKIIKNAEMSKLVWDQFTEDNDDNERIKRYFHLRPTNRGVTIVTTLSGYEMRGVHKHDREGLTKALSVIADCYRILVSLNDVKKNKKMSELGFAKRHRRSKNRESSLEEVIQATMINTMSGNLGLAKALNVQRMQFIASELIFKKGRHRVDIVGFDGNDLYFFELKKERTLKIGQVSEYIRYYNEPKNNDILKRLLKTYPINPINDFQSIKGVMVMKYAENSDYRYGWMDEEKKHDVDILFYNHSLSYKKSS